jgi:hypothetical protein
VSALAQCQDLLAIQERTSGPEHLDTITVRQDHAHWTGMAGDAVRARDEYAALLPVADRALGADHPRTVSIRSNLARWTAKTDATPARPPRHRPAM